MNKNLLKDSLIGNASYPISQLKATGGYAGISYDGITIFRLIFASGYKWQANGFAAYGYSFA
jgi:hypothetical protein